MGPTGLGGGCTLEWDGVQGLLAGGVVGPDAPVRDLLPRHDACKLQDAFGWLMTRTSFHTERCRWWHWCVAVHA